MSNETTRRNAENRRGGRVLETELEQPAAAPSVDEDAAAFLEEAAAAAAAAALEAEELAAEVEEAEVARAASVADEAEELAAAVVEPAVADEELAAAVEPPVADEELAADADEPSFEAEERTATAEEPSVDEERLAGDADGDAETEATFDPEEIAAEAEALAAELEAETQARQAAADAEQVEHANLDTFAEEEDAALRTEMERELSEEAPTAEEEALAQADEERDPEAEIEPADIAEPEEEQGFDKIAARARRLDEDQARHVVHSILFVADKPVTVEQLRNATGLEPARVRASLERLAGELREGISGVVLSEVAGAWQLRTAPESGEFVRRFLQVKPRRLTRAALETLAIIAYRQPVTRPEIEDIRGVDCGAVVKALLDWKLIKILGKKDEVGRPLLYGTSREFLEFFQLKDLASLPTLREFHELNEESVQIVEEELGPEAAAGIAGTVAELTDPAYLEAEKERVAKSEQALAELEQALADAEARSNDVARTINPPKETEEPVEAPPEGEERSGD